MRAMICDNRSCSGSAAGPVPEKMVVTSPSPPGSSIGALEGDLVTQVGQLHLGAQVDALAVLAVPDQCGQRPAVQVVALESGVAERHYQRQEPVHPHEPAQRVAEGVLVLVFQSVEAVDGGLQGGVDLGVGALAEQQGCGPLDLAGVEHVEAV